MNGDHVHDHDHDEFEGLHELAYDLVDRALTAIGGLQTEDPMQAIDTVVAMYRRALEKLTD
ncbi:MAG: hypothetical protein GIW95_07730 [Candidatus Eremiobacteraeota bacterium]|nr:hypothetical protein [Candidatus Eremiobacteraeota bacterium]